MIKIDEARKRAILNYMENTVDTVRFYVPKGQKDVLKAEAKKRGISLNKMITDALQAYLDAKKDG